ncbi:MAG: Ig-like domain-containing protein [Bacteroidota bacterium]
MKSFAHLAYLLLLCLGLGSFFPLSATTGKYRLSYRDDPSTTVVIGWDQESGNSPVVLYDTVDHGTNHTLYAWTHNPDRTVNHKGMDNHFARLTGLNPNTKYYFLIRDSQGNSDRFWFRTIPNDPTMQLSIIAGGDSRSNPAARQRCNRMVAKLRPHFVLFGGDYTNLNTLFEWDDWMEDWQETIAADGRMTPIVATRGNHELSNNDVYRLFDVPSSDVYYALNFGGDLLRTYTLNTEISQSGNQATWLANDLAANEGTVSWMFAQYHRPCRPHESGKSNQTGVYNDWIPEFEDHGVRLVVECDAHVVKRTFPIRKGTSGLDYDEGFYRDDSLGITYVGEGTWAPLRGNDDDKLWTRNSGSFNAFKWIWVNQCEVQLRTVRTTNEAIVGSLTDANIFTFPPNIDLWNPSNGEVVTLENYACDPPAVSLDFPLDGAYYPAPQSVNLTATALDNAPGFVSYVEFFANGVSLGVDSASPYGLAWNIPSNGSYALTAVARDNDSQSATSATVNIDVGELTTLLQVNASSDDAEERANGSMSLTSSDLELVWDNGDQQIGMRFNGVPVPQGSTVSDAYLQFTVDETSSGATDLTVWGESVDDAATFGGSSGDIANRPRTTASAQWNNVPAWNTTGLSGADQQFTGLASIIEEIVNRPGWTAGNSLSLIVEGTGERIAESYDGSAGAAPVLVIVYTLPGGLLSVPTTVNFRAHYNRSEIKLSWSAYHTPADARFLVQRSFNGLDFQTIGEVAGRESMREAFYAFSDYDIVQPGDRYYRLSIIGSEGEVEYSQVQMITLGNTLSSIRIYPIPAKNFLKLSNFATTGLQTVEIWDLQGRRVFVRDHFPAILELSLDISRLKPGLYFIELKSADGILRKRFLKE